MAQADITSRIQKAKQEGFSDQQIFSTLSSDQGFSKRIAMARKEGFSDSQIANQLGLNIQVNMGTQQPIRVQATREPYDWKADQEKSMREQAKKDGETKWWESALLGISDRGAGIVQGALAAKDAITGGDSYKKFTKQRADIEKYHNMQRQENNQGFDLARLGANVALDLPLGVAGLGKTVLGTAARSGAIGATLGGTTFAENANQRVGNTVLGGIGGAAGGVAGEKIGKGLAGAWRRLNPNNATTPQIDAVINIALNQSDNSSIQGMTVANLSQSARDSVRNEVKKLLKQGKQPDQKTLERLAVFSDLKASGVDLKPTGKQATGNPQLWTKESELAKLDGGEALSKRYVQQGDDLTQAINDFQNATGGASTGRLQTGESIISALNKQDDARKQVISDLYKLAKDHTGNDLQLDASAIARNAQQLIDDNFALPDRAIPGLMSRLKPYLPKPNDPTHVPKPFTLRDKELIVKQINSALPKMDQQNKVAFGLVRDALEQETDDALVRMGGALQGEAKNAWDAARQSARDRFGLINRNPALQQAIDDAAPDKFFQQQVLSADVRDVKALVDEIKSDPQAFNNVRQEIIRFIANKTVSDTTGNVSPKAMNDALKSIGDDKLKMFFSPDELKHLKNLNAASRYLFSQPRGSNVNNSNSASAFANMMGYMGLLKRIPVVGPKAEQVVNSGIRGVNAQIKINQGGNAISKTATNAPTPDELNLYQRLVQAGLISGANASKE